MNRIATHEIPAFLRRFRLKGGRIRRIRVLYPRPKEIAIEFHVALREPTPVRLVLRLDGVEEFRLQMRPSLPKSRIADAHIGYLKGLFYVSLDSLGLEPTEVPQVFDYRVSETFAGGRELFWREVPRKPKPNAEPPA